MNRIHLLPVFFAAMVAVTASHAKAQFLVIAGSYQGWNPPNGTVMTNMGGGIYQATITGLNPGDFHEFKILETNALPAAWGNPEWTANNNWFRVDPAGNITIRLNTNIGSTGQNNQNVGTSSTNWTPQLVGNFMDESGGTSDWSNPDPTFNMTYMSGNKWTKTITVSTPGSYLFKLVTNGQWSTQFNIRGYADLFAEDFTFSTSVANEQVKFTFDTFEPSVTVENLVASGPSIVNHGIYHASYSGSGTPPWNAIDDQKQLVRRSTSSQLMTLANLTNSSQGINGILLDFDELSSLSGLSFQYAMSPTGAFVESSNPISGWATAPAPSSVTLHPNTGLSGSDRVLIQWANNQIANRYLCVRVIYNSNVIAEFYLGHLLGETTGVSPPGSPFTCAFADITNIRGAVGSTVTAGNPNDIDKSGTVAFADISAMRSNVGAQLTQITIPAQ